MDREITVLAGTMHTFQAKNTGYQIRTCYGEYGVGSHLDARKCRKNRSSAVDGPTISIAAPISLLESFTGSFRQSSEFVQLDTPVNETDSSGYDF